MTKQEQEQARPVKVPDGKEALQRAAQLTRRLVQVPKSELPDEKKPRRKRR